MMTSSQVDKIDSGLSCDICLESCRDTLGLPCQHVFCFECLEGCVAASPDKRTLVCPTCRNGVKISIDGVLPVHFIVKRHMDAVETDKMVKCSNCNDENNKTTVRCLDCKQYLCDTCHSSHRRLKTMRNHRVVPVQDILSGKVCLAEEESVCKHHKQPHNYYCMNDMIPVCQDCVILKKCMPYHDRITIDAAVEEKSADLKDLIKRGCKILKTYQDSIKEVNVIENELARRSKVAKDVLAKVEMEYIKLIKKTVKGFEDEIDSIKEERMMELDRKKASFNSAVKDIEKANEAANQVIQSPYKMEVISSHATLSKRLKTVSTSQPDEVDKTLGYVKFVAAIPSITNIGQLLEDNTPWEFIEQFSTGDLKDLCGLALDEDDNIVACSWEKGVKVLSKNAIPKHIFDFTKDNHVKSTLYEAPGSVDVGVLLGKKYVSVPVGEEQIKICDSQGKQAITSHITNVNNIPSYANSVTVDSDNKIIVGQVEKTISIHNADGTVISKFATQSIPFRLAATPNGQIVSSFYDRGLARGTSVQLLDYSGGNVRVIQPPDEVKVWEPGFVCCEQGEIFVSNPGSGDPTGIYRYTSEGNYLSCVTTQVGNPAGIALSRDCRELFVADRDDNHIKIFQRP